MEAQSLIFHGAMFALGAWASVVFLDGDFGFAFGVSFLVVWLATLQALA